MTVAKAKVDHAKLFNSCTSIRDEHPWLRQNTSTLVISTAAPQSVKYMKVAQAKCVTRSTFDRCASIRDVLDIGKTPKEPKRTLEVPTADELRVVRKLQELVDHPSTPEGIKANAQTK